MKSSTIRRSTLSRETMEVIENLAKDEEQNGLPNEYVRPEEIEASSLESDNKSQEIDLLWQNFKNTQFNTNSPLAYIIGGFLSGVVATILVLVCVGAIAIKSDTKVPKKAMFNLEKLFASKKSPEQTLEQQADSSNNIANMQVSVPTEDETTSNVETPANSDVANTGNVKEFKKYVVKSGDTGESIIKHYYGSWSQEKADLVMKANNMTNFDKINIGQELIIPIQE